MKVTNSKGTVWYGMHFYPGVAEYCEPNKDPFRVFLNEDTIRAMDPSFAGRPVFVMHVDEVSANVDELKKDADGWVIESFFNKADGKHWVKFLVCSDKGEKAIKRGMKLSNCYRPKSFAGGGLWNGVSYAKEIRGGEYEHLAIVPNPRYEESVIMTPDEFKAYNSQKLLELDKLANNKGEGEMKINFFKRAKVENAVDLSETYVVLEKSKREVSISTLVNEADEAAVAAASREPKMANSEHLVDVGGTKMTLNELVAKHEAMCSELEAMKKKNEDGDEDADDMQNEEDDDKKEDDKKDDDKKSNSKDDEESEDDKAEETARVANELEEKRKQKEKEKEKADRLRNAPNRVSQNVAKVDLPEDKVARGKARYGS